MSEGMSPSLELLILGYLRSHGYHKAATAMLQESGAGEKGAFGEDVGKEKAADDSAALTLRQMFQRYVMDNNLTVFPALKVQSYQGDSGKKRVELSLETEKKESTTPGTISTPLDPGTPNDGEEKKGTSGTVADGTSTVSKMDSLPPVSTPNDPAPSHMAIHIHPPDHSTIHIHAKKVINELVTTVSLAIKAGDKKLEKESSETTSPTQDPDTVTFKIEPAAKVTKGEKVEEKEPEKEDKDKYLRLQVAERIAKYSGLSVKEKQARYRCDISDVLQATQDIRSWPEFAAEKGLSSPEPPRFPVLKAANDRLKIYCGDITHLEVDAIVNAANNRCLGGGGVDGVIHSAAGPGLYDECRLLHGCPTGQAKITYGYDLPAKHVIHAVGPAVGGSWFGEKKVKEEDKEQLVSAYLSALRLAEEHQLRSIAFPCLSTGIYGFPNDKAAILVAQALRQYFETDPYAEKMEAVILVLYLRKDLVEYATKALRHFFPF